MKAEKIEKYYVDFDGSIVIMKKGSCNKVKITSVSNKENKFVLKTHTEEELKLLLGTQ